MFSSSFRHLQSTAARRALSSKSALEADTGPLATRMHHHMTVGLAVLTPLYFMVPSDGLLDKAMGLFLSVNITAHSWIGLNYVATDYVPKISKSLLGPARIVNAGIAAVTLLGMSKMALSKGGIKGVVKGLWNPKKSKTEFDF